MECKKSITNSTFHQVIIYDFTLLHTISNFIIKDFVAGSEKSTNFLLNLIKDKSVIVTSNHELMRDGWIICCSDKDHTSI